MPARLSTAGVALGAGVLGAVQPKINAVLGDRLDDSLVASLVNFVAALIAVSIAVLVRPATRAQLRAVRRWPVPRWTLSAGAGGALVVLSGVVAVETIGVAAFSVAFFAGQVAFGLVLDRLGVAPGGRRSLTAVRVGAAALAIVAVVASQAGREVDDLEPALLAFVALAGAASALQSSANGRITAAIRDPVAATAVNVMVGVGVLAIVAVTGGAFDGVTWPAAPWLYTGGLLGVTIVLSLAIATAALGVLRTTILMLAAQLVTAFVVDWIVYEDPPTIGAVAGAALVVVAVLLVRRPSR